MQKQLILDWKLIHDFVSGLNNFFVLCTPIFVNNWSNYLFRKKSNQRNILFSAKCLKVKDRRCGVQFEIYFHEFSINLVRRYCACKMQFEWNIQLISASRSTFASRARVRFSILRLQKQDRRSGRSQRDNAIRSSLAATALRRNARYRAFYYGGRRLFFPRMQFSRPSGLPLLLRS